MFGLAQKKSFLFQIFSRKGVKEMAEYPKKGQEFELTLDGDAQPPLDMVRDYGYSQPEKWEHTGTAVTGIHTRRFKLVSVGYCRNLKAVRRKLEEHGEIPEGQWLEAFKEAFPESDGKGPVGVADPSWVNPLGFVRFPCVRSFGFSGFPWAGRGFHGRWRWLLAL